MPKYKTKTKDCHLTVKVKLSGSEFINSNELGIFNQKYVRGFLKPIQMKRNVVLYTGPVGISLHARMAKPIVKYDFFFIVEQVNDTIRKLQISNIPWNRVVWDLNHVYINEQTKELQFIFLPLQNNTVGADLFGFLYSIIYSARPSDQDTNYLSQFTYFVKSLKYFDFDQIERYISGVDRSIVNTIKKHNTGQSGFMTDKPKDYYDHYDKKNDPEEDEEPTGLLAKNDPYGFHNGSSDDEPTGLLVDEEATDLLSEGSEDTALPDSDDEATGLLTENNVHYPILFRTLTQEKIFINKPVFRLGKEKSYVDYFVSNNNAVSRGHADIITRGQRYFVTDLNSKNKTFINGAPIPPQTEVELFDGNELRLGNEEFVFYI